MNTSGVYAILNLFNDRLYIGSAKYIRARLSWHHLALAANKHHSVLLQRAWDKYGEDSFIFFVLERTESLLDREQYWMDRFTSYNVDCGYNIYVTAGSPAKRKHTEETKAKIGAWNKGRKLSDETKKRMSEAQNNRSPEWRANHSAALKKRVFSPEHRAKLSEANLKRKPMSDETKRRMSISQKLRAERQGYAIKPKQ